MSKIRIRIGALEVEYEGTDDFLRDELPLLLDKLAKLDARVSPVASEPSSPVPSSGTGQTDTQLSNSAVDLGRCSNVAASLGAKTGPKLAIAAAARLTLGDRRSSFTRKELLDEMKSATAYYNKNMGSNLSTTISGLIKAKKFKEIAVGTYGLAADTITELRSRLGS